MAIQRFSGIVMSQRDYRERDLLVKILTKPAGPVMFLVRGAKRPQAKLAAAVQPLTAGQFQGSIHSSGLSYLTSVDHYRMYTHTTMDLLANAYATYLLALIDVAFDDNQALGDWYSQVEAALNLIEAGRDPQIIVNVMEIRLLARFGVAPVWDRCVICGRSDLAMSFSEELGGMLCANHVVRDPHCLHLRQKTAAYLALLSRIDLRRVGDVDVDERTKAGLRKVIDTIYDDEVGLRLKSKRYLQQMHLWDRRLKLNPPKN